MAHSKRTAPRIISSYDIETWENIARIICRNPRTAMRWSQREIDPLPVRKLGHHVVASSQELGEWLDRNADELNLGEWAKKP